MYSAKTNNVFQKSTDAAARTPAWGQEFPIRGPIASHNFPGGHPIHDGHRVVAEPVLGGLHHEYWLEPMAA